MKLILPSKYGGFIAYYELNEWWASSFSEQERLYIRNKVGDRLPYLDDGNIKSSSLHVATFLNSLSTYFKSKKDKFIFDRIQERLDHLDKQYTTVQSTNVGSVTNKGFIYFYNLQEWWENTFNQVQMNYICQLYRPIGYPDNCLIQGEIHSFISITAFLYSLLIRFRTESINISQEIEKNT